jgi:hypothetical protein
MNTNGPGGSQIAAVMAILFLAGFCAGAKKAAHPTLRDEAA